MSHDSKAFQHIHCQNRSFQFIRYVLILPVPKNPDLTHHSVLLGLQAPAFNYNLLLNIEQ